MKTKWAGMTLSLLVAALLGWSGGCKKSTKPSRKSRAVRCGDFADDFAGALQDSGMVGGSQPEKAIAQFDEKLRAACMEGKVPDSVFQCLGKVRPRVFSKMLACLPEDLRDLVPELSESDESGGNTEEPEEDSDESP